MGDLGEDAKRHAPATTRNVDAIGAVLDDWLPEEGFVLELSSGTGEHAVAFARRFPKLTWQPSDPDLLALASIEAWRQEQGTENLRGPLMIDTRDEDWDLDSADSIVSINMAHIAPWEATLALLEGAARLLPDGGRLIFYGPWFSDEIEAAPSNLAFDESLKSRDSAWGIRRVEDIVEAAAGQGLKFAEKRLMPANNMMLLFTKS